MPAKALWLLQIPEIVALLDEVDPIGWTKFRPSLDGEAG